jgi:hypothetical protein
VQSTVKEVLLEGKYLEERGGVGWGRRGSGREEGEKEKKLISCESNHSLYEFIDTFYPF